MDDLGNNKDSGNSGTTTKREGKESKADTHML